MRADFRTACTAGCSRELADGYFPFCPDCGAMTDVTYDLDAVRLRDSANPYHRYVDLLPVRDPQLLPRDAVATPVVHADELGRRLGVPSLYLKNETVLPTGTTKDRMAAVALPYLFESGVRHFTTSSTGNSSTAYAQAISRLPGMVMTVVTAEAFRDRVSLEAPPGAVIDVVARDATFVDAFAIAGQLAAEHNWTSESGFFNPGRREGLKVAWLEAAEQVPGAIDWYVQAVSSAMGVHGVDKAAHEFAAVGLGGPPPRLLCVQQESCAPMVTAWRDGAEAIRPSDIVARPAGIAAAILRGDPTRTYPHVRRVVARSQGDMMAVGDAEILAARRWLADGYGIAVCNSAATALAGVAEAVSAGVIGASDTVLVSLTGADRRSSAPDESTRWVERGRDGWDLTPVT